MSAKRITKPAVSLAAPDIFQNLAWWVEPEPNPASSLSQFRPISLAQMAEVALMDRIETKFVFHERTLLDILLDLSDQYRVLEIDKVHLNHYRTLYFDTADFALYRRHHTGDRNRYKVRSRKYIDTNLSFLEVKHKVCKNRTVKHRVRTDQFVTRLAADSTDFLDTHLPRHLDGLETKLWNEYTRITLVGIDMKERVTFDLSITR